MLDYRIKTFLCCCDFMNFTKAAHELNMTQPGVSQQIRRLEEEYHTSFFEYRDKKLSLTNAGLRLLHAARVMDHDLQILKDHIRYDSDTLSHISFGATLTIGEFVMPEKLATFNQLYPHVNISMKIDNTTNLLQDLENGSIDFALIEGYFSKSDYINKVWQTVPFIPVATPEYVMNHFKNKQITLSTLFSHRLFLREDGSGTREILSRYLQEQNYTLFDFPYITEINSMHAIKDLVLKGCGISFLYKTVVEAELKMGLLMEVPLNQIPTFHEFTYIRQKDSIFQNEYNSFLCTCLGFDII